MLYTFAQILAFFEHFLWSKGEKNETALDLLNIFNE